MVGSRDCHTSELPVDRAEGRVRVPRQRSRRSSVGGPNEVAVTYSGQLGTKTLGGGGIED